MPQFDEVTRLSKRYNLIPICKEIWADIETPIRVFHHFYEEKYAFLLESVEGGVNWGRYSFIGTDPFMIIRGKNGKIEIRERDAVRHVDAKPIEALKELLANYNSPDLEGLPRFTGGAVGFFGYDLLQYYENIPAHPVDDLGMDDIQFMLCDQVIVFDHVKQQLKIIANVHVPDDADDADVRQAYEETCASIERTVARLQKPVYAPPMGSSGSLAQIDLGEVHSNFTKEQFMDRVAQAKTYVHAGDILQVVISQRFMVETDVTPLHVYRILRSINPSPYMYYLKLDEEIIVGTSPELLVRVEGDRVLNRPIAGTRPRGSTEAEDNALAKELLADEKERAEHLMLVDLGRNDLGKVSEAGTVRCDSFMEVERYSHVMHIVSNVSGKLRADQDFYDAFLSCLPAGTVSGAPKLRAMQIIAELEHEARGPYAGAIGYLGFSGNLDTCITIRTIIFKNGKAYVQAGAGIVGDSVPEMEYEETKNKAKAMLKAIRMAEASFSGNKSMRVKTNQDYFIPGGQQ